MPSVGICRCSTSRENDLQVWAYAIQLIRCFLALENVHFMKAWYVIFVAWQPYYGFTWFACFHWTFVAWKVRAQSWNQSIWLWQTNGGEKKKTHKAHLQQNVTRFIWKLLYTTLYTNENAKLFIFVRISSIQFLFAFNFNTRCLDSIESANIELFCFQSTKNYQQLTK